MKVTHCICHNKLISEIVEQAAKLRLTSMEQVSKMIGCCDKCCLCAPYIEKELKKK